MAQEMKINTKSKVIYGLKFDENLKNSMDYNEKLVKNYQDVNFLTELLMKNGKNIPNFQYILFGLKNFLMDLVKGNEQYMEFSEFDIEELYNIEVFAGFSKYSECELNKDYFVEGYPQIYFKCTKDSQLPTIYDSETNEIIEPDFTANTEHPCITISKCPKPEWELQAEIDSIMKKIKEKESELMKKHQQINKEQIVHSLSTGKRPVIKNIKKLINPMEINIDGYRFNVGRAWQTKTLGIYSIFYCGLHGIRIPFLNENRVTDHQYKNPMNNRPMDCRVCSSEINSGNTHDNFQILNRIDLADDFQRLYTNPDYCSEKYSNYLLDSEFFYSPSTKTIFKYIDDSKKLCKCYTPYYNPHNNNEYFAIKLDDIKKGELNSFVFPICSIIPKIIETDGTKYIETDSNNKILEKTLVDATLYFKNNNKLKQITSRIAFDSIHNQFLEYDSNENYKKLYVNDEGFIEIDGKTYNKELLLTDEYAYVVDYIKLTRKHLGFYM